VRVKKLLSVVLNPVKPCGRHQQALAKAKLSGACMSSVIISTAGVGEHLLAIVPYITVGMKRADAMKAFEDF
jgi:hypothetical protein